MSNIIAIDAPVAESTLARLQSTAEEMSHRKYAARQATTVGCPATQLFDDAITEWATITDQTISTAHKRLTTAHKDVTDTLNDIIRLDCDGAAALNRILLHLYAPKPTREVAPS